ncbi:hypothetical protein ACJ6WF_16950 [Streptomyces sp. MMS24-I2-30]|uniref:hypothetical protein n=1 Tax=Streptomyces sp. MMS24-I2-30 TaxID=3351564 RepID=UPI003896BAD5
MRARVLENFAPYWNYGVHPLKQDDEVSGELAAYLVSTHSPVEPLDDEARALRDAPAEEPQEPTGPPADLDIDGTAADVLAWVGEDPERASKALEQEQAKDKPRSTLVKQLEKLAAADGE